MQMVSGLKETIKKFLNLHSVTFENDRDAKIAAAAAFEKTFDYYFATMAESSNEIFSVYLTSLIN